MFRRWFSNLILGWVESGVEDRFSNLQLVIDTIAGEMKDLRRDIDATRRKVYYDLNKGNGGQDADKKAIEKLVEKAGAPGPQEPEQLGTPGVLLGDDLAPQQMESWLRGE